MSVNADDLIQRINDLEQRMAHYERMADDLSEVVAKQTETIERQAIQLRHIAQQHKRAHSAWVPSPQDDKPPPHY